MNMTAQLDTKNLTFIKGVEDHIKQSVSGEPGWLADFRADNLTRFNQRGIPTTRDEEWKYTNITALAKSQFLFTQEDSLKEAEAFSNYCEGDRHTVVILNGKFSAELSRMDHLPKGISINTFQDAFKNNGAVLEDMFKKFTDDSSPFITLNQALAADGIYIEIDKNTVDNELIHIVHVTSLSKDQAILTPRTVIKAGKSSEATILESHVCFSNNAVYFSNPLTDIALDENAVLHYIKAQNESLKAYHIGSTRVWQERNSNLDSFSLMTGAGVTRNNLDIVLNGEGINSTLNGLYCIDGDQHTDNHTCVDHRFPNCVSNQLYKGILNGSSRAVFNGKIFVQPIAQLTNSYQLNKNLTLGKDCRVDTKPQLEIGADDVKCTHGATIGQLNEDELFYLQTRCVSRKDAIQLLARGFVDDILSTIQNESICRKLHILTEPTFEALG